MQILQKIACQFIVFMFATFFIQGCERAEEFAANTVEVDEVAEQDGFDATLTTTHKGKLFSVIKYGRMSRYAGKKHVRFFDGIELELYDDGVFGSEIFAESAFLDEKKDTIELDGNVRVYSHNGINLRTERLLWNTAQDTVTSDTFVTVITIERDTLYGMGFGSGKSFQNWVIQQPYGVTQKRLNINVLDADKNK